MLGVGKVCEDRRLVAETADEDRHLSVAARVVDLRVKAGGEAGARLGLAVDQRDHRQLVQQGLHVVAEVAPEAEYREWSF